MKTVSVLIAALLLPGFTGMAQAQSKGGQADEIDLSTLAVCNAPPSEGALQCRCPSGFAAGSVWGSGPYTADSSVCTAARHAGIIGEEGGAVQLVHRPGQASYTGTVANGVSTSSWGSYGQSFDVLAIGDVPVASGPEACGALPDGTDTLSCSCTAQIAGPVWGSGPYTADSNICSAARHAGAVAESGVVRVLRVQGMSGYSGSDANGETTMAWGSYDSSIVFDRN